MARWWAVRADRTNRHNNPLPLVGISNRRRYGGVRPLVHVSRCISVLLVIAWCISASAANHFADAEQFVASIPGSLPDHSITAKGDLTDDGRDDLAIVVQSRNGQPDHLKQLYVLTQGSAGRFTLAASSQNVPMTGRGCCWVESLAIDDGELSIQNNAKTACNIESATHRFERYGDRWRLIGVRIIDSQHCEDAQMMDTRDIDVLTGTTKHSRQPDGQSIKRWTTHAPARVYLLKDYDFFNGFGTPEAR